MEQLINLIKKLSFITEDNGATEAEALNAAEKIAAIKDKYNIELEDLEINEYAATSEDIIIDYIRIPQYLQTLIANLAYAFNCKVIRTPSVNKKSIFTVIGLSHDVVICNHFYKYLSRVLINESKNEKNKNSFCIGMIDSIMKKLVPVKNNVKEQPTKEQHAVVINRNAAIDKYIKEKIGRTRTQKRYYKKDLSAYDAGRNRGNTVSLSKPVQGNGQIKIGM